MSEDDKVLRDRIDATIEAWHNELDTDKTLPEWLGWTKEEYAIFVERGEIPDREKDRL